MPPCTSAYDDQAKVIDLLSKSSGIDENVASVSGHPLLWEASHLIPWGPVVAVNIGLTFSSSDQVWANHFIIPWCSVSGLRWPCDPVKSIRVFL